MRGQDHGTPFVETATNATLAVASHAAVATKTYYVTDIGVSSDKAGSIVLVKSGTTVIWQQQVGAGHLEKTFATPLKAALGALVSVEIDGTALCNANIAGYEL
jgi:hypothetical protein